MRRRNMLLLALAVLLAFVLAGCGAQAPAAADGGGALEESYAPEADGGETAAPEESVAAGRKLVYSAELELETLDFAGAESGVRALVAEMGGYLEEARVEGGGEETRRADFTARVPAARFDEALEKFSALGQTVYRTERADDITDAYYDLEAELEALRVQQERLLDLMERAQSVEDLITLEQELTAVRARINERTAQQRQYDGLVDYATIRVELNEVSALSGEAAPAAGFGARLWQTFTGAWGGVGRWLQSVALALAAAAPFLVVLCGFAALAAGIALGATRFWKRKR